VCTCVGFVCALFCVCCVHLCVSILTHFFETMKLEGSPLMRNVCTHKDKMRILSMT
jgi:hypothetical protein